MGGAASAVSSAVGGAVGAVGGAMGGLMGGGLANVLGTGQYKPDQYNVDSTAFTDNSGINNLQGSFQNQLNNVGSQNAQYNANAGAGDQSYQSGLEAQLAAQAAGGGPNLANAQLQQATEQNIKQQMGQATVNPNVSAAMSQRNAMLAGSAANQSAAQNSAINRMNQQLQAQNLLGGVSTQARSQDITNAQNQSQVQLANQAQNNQMNQYYNTGLANLNEQKQNNLMALQTLKANQTAQNNTTAASSFNNQQGRAGSAIGGLGQGIASMAAMPAAAAVALSKGGVVQRFAKGGIVKSKKMALGGSVGDGSFAASLMNKYSQMNNPSSGNDSGGPGFGDKNSQGLAAGIGSFGKKKPGEVSTESDEANGEVGNDVNMGMGSGAEALVAKGGLIKKGMEMKKPMKKFEAGGSVDELDMGYGGHVPGHAEVPGNSEKNDKVPVMLSPGEIVLPRTVAKHALHDPKSEHVATFLEALKHRHSQEEGVDHMAEGGMSREGFDEGMRLTPGSTTGIPPHARMAQQMMKHHMDEGGSVDGEDMNDTPPDQTQSGKLIGGMKKAFKTPTNMADGGMPPVTNEQDDEHEEYDDQSLEYEPMKRKKSFAGALSRAYGGY